ncbi:MAG: glycosyltransferase family 4 protein [Thermoplasmata archaeon]
MRSVANWADLGIVHSERTKSLVSKTLSNDLPLVTIPHGNFNMLARSVPSSSTRKRLGIDEEKIVLLMFGPDRRNKGIDKFLEVLKRLPSNYVGMLAGRCFDDEIRNVILREKNRLKSRLIVDLRFIPDDEIASYFSAADIYFIPYDWITTSGSVFFAFAYGKPVITTPKGDLPDLIISGVNGYLASDIKEMVDVISNIGRAEAEEMGNRAFQMAAKYDWKEIAERTVDAYRSISS